jgi:hypothetical protein
MMVWPGRSPIEKVEGLTEPAQPKHLPEARFHDRDTADGLPPLTPKALWQLGDRPTIRTKQKPRATRQPDSTRQEPTATRQRPNRDKTSVRSGSVPYEIESCPYVFGSGCPVPAEIGGERSGEAQPQPSETDGPLLIEERLARQIVIGDVEYESPWLPEQTDDGGRPPVPQGVGGQFGGDHGDPVQAVLVAEGRVHDGVPQVGAQVSQATDTVQSPAAELGRRRVWNRGGRRRHGPILPTPGGKTESSFPSGHRSDHQ